MKTQRIKKTPLLGLDMKKIEKARELSNSITEKVQEYIDTHTTVTIERASLRLLGADGANSDGVPVPNLIVDKLKDKVGEGISKYYINALIKTGKTIDELNKDIADGFDISTLPMLEFEKIKEKADEIIKKLDEKLEKNISYRNQKLREYSQNEKRP